MKCVNCKVPHCRAWLCGDCWRIAIIAAIASWLVTTILNAAVSL